MSADRRYGVRSILPPRFDPSNLKTEFIPTIGGATAGLVSGVVTCPLDVIKTKLQAQGGWSIRNAGGGAAAKKYRGLVGTASMIWKEDGLRGMYRGLGPLVFGYLPTWMVYFTMYEQSKRVLEAEFGHTQSTYIFSSIVAGATSTLCTNPIWVIKTRLMSQTSSLPSRSSPYHYTSTLDAARKMWRYEGIRSFYSGLGPALLGLTHVAVQFPLYEYFKKTLTGGIELGQQSADGSMQIGGIIAASVLSKIAASSATYPHEVLRTRLQTQRIRNGQSRSARYRGLVSSALTIYREEGWRAFYAGMGTNMVRAVPSSAMTILTYECMSAYLWEAVGGKKRTTRATREWEEDVEWVDEDVR